MNHFHFLILVVSTMEIASVSWRETEGLDIDAEFGEYYVLATGPEWGSKEKAEADSIFA